jgi:putative peptidoglycan lipid II flippase
LWSTLSKHGDFVADSRLKRNLPLIVLASVVMVAALLATSHFLSPYYDHRSGFFVKASILGVEIAIGLAVFAVFILATRVMSLRQLGRLTRRQG